MATPAAYDHAHGRRIMALVEARGIEVERLASKRSTGVRGETDRETYARAKATMAIAPSADWRFDLAEGCPAHCQYCYLAGSLSGPPVTRVYADLDDILAGLAGYAGRGTITSRRAARRDEGTTFEASCYTDPLALEHLTGSWRRAVEHFGGWDAPVQLRWTTKFDDIAGSWDYRTPAAPGSGSASTAPRSAPAWRVAPARWRTDWRRCAGWPWTAIR